MTEIIVLTLAGIVLSYTGVAGLRYWAERHDALDVPNERSSHRRPVPRGAGLAIVLVTLGGIVICWFRQPDWPVSALVAYVVGAGSIAGISWLDDLYSLSRRVRFAAHSLSALIVIVGLGYWHTVNIPFLGQVTLGWVGVPLTFLWVTGLTNAYNFMDGIDGIAGGQAVVAGFLWALLGWFGGQRLVGELGLLLAASSLGFLGHNWPPARIFMGDVGSAFLGFTFAVLPVVAARHDPALALCGVLVFWAFTFDTTYTLIRRRCRGENILAAHRSHLYQRLLIAGYKHRFLSSLYIVLAIAGGTLALLWSQRAAWSSAAIALCLPVLCLTLWRFVIQRELKFTPPTAS